MQHQLVRSQNRYLRGIGALLTARTLDQCLSELRDEQIGQLVRDVVERDVAIASPAAVVCGQAIRRLIRSAAGRLEEEPDPMLICRKCSGDAVLHIGIDEPDCIECIDLNCKHREYISTEAV